MAGAFVLALAAHRPWGDEAGLLEAWTGSYLPLLEAVERLRDAGVRAPLALAVSPAVFAMLEDAAVRARARDELLRREGLCREAGPGEDRPALEFHAGRFRRAAEALAEGAAPFSARLRELEEDGAVELMAPTPANAVLPLLLEPQAVAGQLRLAASEHRHRFGDVPAGLWLGGCAYDARLGPLARAAGFEYAVLEHHALERARPRPRCGPYAPVRAPGGLFTLARDPAAAREASRLGSYARPEYAEPELDLGLLEAGPGVAGGPAGIRCRRVTGDVSLAAKEPYDPAAARLAAGEHAEAFASALEARAAALERDLKTRPILVGAYPAETFGAPWLEGPWFVESLLRRLAGEGKVQARSPSWVLSHAAEAEEAEPEASSWGPGGYLEAWLRDSNAWLLPHVHGATERMLELAVRFGPKAKAYPSPLEERALAACGRLTALLQSGDWPELAASRGREAWVRARFGELVGSFLDLRERLEGKRVDEESVARAEGLCRGLPSADFRVWA